MRLLRATLLTLLLASPAFAQQTPQSIEASASATQSAGCADDIAPGLIKEVISSDRSRIEKSRELVLLTKTSYKGDWQTLTRKGEVQSALVEIADGLLPKQGAVIAADEQTAIADSIKSALKKALDAACQNLNAEAGTLRGAVKSAAGIPSPPEVAKAVTVDAAPQITSSDDKLGKGDRLKFAARTPGFIEDETGKPAAAPCGSKFRINGLEEQGSMALGLFTYVPAKGERTTIGMTDACAAVRTDDAVLEHIQYKISITDLDRAAANVSGFKWGVLVAPYKFHFSDDSTTPSATIGGYVGFEFGNARVSIAPIFSIGLGAVTETVVKPADETGQVPSAATLASMSAAAGVLFRIRKASGFTVGILFGSDWTGQEESYKYDGKLWAAVSIGLAVTQ